MSSDPPPEVPKPAIVIVPGAFHTAAHFQPLTTALQRLSYDTTTITLPSIGAKAGTATLEDDIQTIRSTLERLAEDEREILLMLHAYGGVPGCQAVRGLEKSQQKEEEKKGGIAQILFMGGFVPESNQSLVEALGGGMPSWAKAEDNVLYPAKTSSVFYNDLSPKEADHYSSILRSQSAVTSTTPVKDVCYDLDVPIIYLLCNGDPMFHILQGMMEKVRGPNWMVHRMEGDHSPFLSNKEGLIRLVDSCVSLMY